MNCRKCSAPMRKAHRHRLVCGNSADFATVQALMDGELADMIFTDPPYNQAGAGHTSAAGIRDSYKRLAQSAWDTGFSFEDVQGNLLSALAPNASVYICTSQHLAGTIWEWMKQWADFHNYCVWRKSNPMPSLHKRHWTWCAELVCYATRGKHTFNFPDEGHALSVWDVAKTRVNDLHPTMKPVAMPQHAIEHSSNPGDIVLDLFGGSGSTLMAAEASGRRCFMAELSPAYCDVIINRWSKTTGQQPQLLTKAEV